MPLYRLGQVLASGPKRPAAAHLPRSCPPVPHICSARLRSITRLVLAAACGVLSVPASAATRTGSPSGEALPDLPRVLIVAVGDEQPVFDRFVADFARRLEAREVAGVSTFSASGLAGGKLDSADDVYSAIRALRRGRPGGCLVYLTGHGSRAGMSLPLSAERSTSRPYTSLKVADMDAALRDGCGAAPTVVVFSACYSGVYLRPGVTGPDRVVLSAAASDRTSFGCGDDETHSYYDGCFLRSFDAAATWRQLAALTSLCVSGLERQLLPRPRPSRPQAWFGDRVRDLSLPGRRKPG